MKKLFPFILLLLLVGKLSAQYDDKIKAVFIKNVIRELEWQKEYQTGDFIIGIIGKSSVGKELLKIGKFNPKTGPRNFVVKHFNSVAEIEKCHLIFISMEESKLFKEIDDKVLSYNTLVVTEKDGLAKIGSCMNFIISQGRTCYEVNRKGLERHGIKASYNFIRLAIIID